TLIVNVTLRNEGARSAEETAFLFVHDKLACVTRPRLDLKGFEKITLQPGESGTLRFDLSGTAFRFPGPDLRPLFEPGEVEILAGPSAARSLLLSATVRLVCPFGQAPASGLKN